MVLPSCLFDPTSPIVLDASVIINLNATGQAAKILAALPGPAVVTDVVAKELEAGRARGRRDSDQLAAMVRDRDVERVELSSESEGHFLDLVSGPGISTLDDGEAATLAWAVVNRGIPILDDKKAIAICHKKYPSLPTASSMDIFAYKNVGAVIGERALADAIFSALTIARMRVPEGYLDWVVNLIGKDRATICHSLPERARSQQ